MATVIRFSRHGTKKKPYYRIVVQDSRSPRDGRFIEHIGAFDPVKGSQTLVIERERLMYWLGCGAKMSESVANTVKPRLKEWEKGIPESPKPEAKHTSKEV
jgi:small subunit ribosomal protein S16